MVKYNDKMILTVGEYNYMNKAQEKNSVFGKVVALDLNKKNSYNQLAMGVRNSQGLYYSDEKNIIFLTDHGPQGGDEINFIDLNKDTNNESVNDEETPKKALPPMLSNTLYDTVANFGHTWKDFGKCSKCESLGRKSVDCESFLGVNSDGSI